MRKEPDGFDRAPEGAFAPRKFGVVVAQFESKHVDRIKERGRPLLATVRIAGRIWRFPDLTAAPNHIWEANPNAGQN